MSRRLDYVVVGSGLTGATIARMLHDWGCGVLVVERRDHIGGNVHDRVHSSGIRFHTYGPHYFRTNSPRIWTFVTRFADFYQYEARVTSWVDGCYENWPVSRAYIAERVGNNWKPTFAGRPSDFEEASLRLMPRVIYEKFVKGYTEKQWGVPARQLAASLARRLEVREDTDPRFSRHRFQGLPTIGYSLFMQRLLAGIPVVVKCDFLREPGLASVAGRIVYTGPIDEFFGWRLGRLLYRGQSRRHEYLADADYVQPCGQVNNPGLGSGSHIRTLEWKHMMLPGESGKRKGTLITCETPETPSDPEGFEYPFPDARNEALYRRYRALARGLHNIVICGRLGEYRYYDMDQAIGRAMQIARRLMISGACDATEHRASGMARLQTDMVVPRDAGIT